MQDVAFADADANFRIERKTQKKRAFDLLLTIPGISECLRFRRSIDIRYMRIFLGKS